MLKKKNKCSVVSCENTAICKGYCSKHYQQIKLSGKIKDDSFIYMEGMCKNLGCGKKIFAKGLCQTCYRNERQENAKTI
jgi:hypothetical protein